MCGHVVKYYDPFIREAVQYILNTSLLHFPELYSIMPCNMQWINIINLLHQRCMVLHGSEYEGCLLECDTI